MSSSGNFYCLLGAKTVVASLILRPDLGLQENRERVVGIIVESAANAFVSVDPLQSLSSKDPFVLKCFDEISVLSVSETGGADHSSF